MIEQIPLDVLFIVLRYLSVSSISNLARTCRTLQAIIDEYGWKIYALENPLPSQSLTPALEYSRWSMRDLLHHQILAEKAWRKRKFVARPLGPEWTSKFHPVMAINSSRLVVAAGNAVFCYKFSPPDRHSEAPRVRFERVLTFPKDARKDISGVAFELDGSGLILSFVHGALGRIRLPESSEYSRRPNSSVKAPPISYIKEHGYPIRSMSAVQNTVLTLDAAGMASIYSLSDPSSPSVSTVNIGGPSRTAGWSTHLSLNSSSGYAVLGTSSMTPLNVHAITESGLLPYPQVVLSSSKHVSATSKGGAVYAISGATHTFPWSSDQIVVAGWYQGMITLHDLRCPTRPGHDSLGKGPILNPTLILQDPLAQTPIYSLSSAGAYIVGGSAQHSLVQLYDVRSTKMGWSIYLPGGRSISSPVYSCLLESTRLWAATESRACVVDFGQVNECTFPSLREQSTLNRPTSNIGWHAPFYEHSMFFITCPNGDE